MLMPDVMLQLSADDIRRALPMSAAIDAMRDAFTQLARGEVILPPRSRMDAPAEQSVALVMPCHSSVLKLYSVKFITLSERNRARGMPLIRSTVMISDGDDGRPLALLEGASLTALRTGAASGLATDLLARPDADSVALIGGGIQARTQLEAVCCVRRIRRVWVYDSVPGAAARLADEMRRPGFEVDAVESTADALRHADIVCTATTAKAPVFEDRDVPPGTHINAIGVFQPDRAEVPAETVRRARVVVDHRASSLEEAGDLLMPLRAGLIGEDHISAELGPLLLGKMEGRTSAGQITLFKSVGVAIQDLCAAARALDAARRMGIGTPMHL